MKHFKKLLRSVTRSKHINRRVILYILIPLVLIAIFGVIGAYRLGQSSAVTPCTISAKQVNSCRPWLGAWAAKYPQPGAGFQNQLLYHEQRIGRNVELVKDYLTPGDTLSAADKYFQARANTNLVITWRPATQWADAGGGNATINAQIDRMADSIKSTGSKKLFLSLHHEPENDVSGSVPSCSNTVFQGQAGTAAEYRAMWQNVRQRFDAKGVNNVVWTEIFMGFQRWDCMINDLWPGNQFVDWIMFDPYGNSDKDAFSTSIDHFYEILVDNSDATHNYLSKTWGLAETSVHNTSKANAAKYWQDARTALITNKYPHIKAYIVFDSSNGVPDNRIMYWCDPATAQGPSNPDGQGTCGHLEIDNAEQNAYKAFANDEHFFDSYYLTHPPAPIDTTKPTVMINQLAGPVPAQTTVQISAQANDNVGVTKVKFYIDGQLKHAATAAPYTYSFKPTRVGSYTVTAKAYDAWGNTTMAAPVTVTAIPPDSIDPTVSVSVSQTAVQKDTPITATADATDNVGVTKVNFYVDSSLVSTDTTAPYTTSLSFPTLGRKILTARAYDAIGNVGVSHTVTVNVYDPTVTMPGDVDGDQHINVNDYTALKMNYGKPYPEGDFNGSGTIDSLDFGVVYSNWLW